MRKHLLNEGKCLAKRFSLFSLIIVAAMLVSVPVVVTAEVTAEPVVEEEAAPAAGSCESLIDLKLPETTITAAESINPILYGEATMKCEKCKTDTDAGEWYQFYYGTLLASWTSYQRRYVDALERVTSKKYRIEGSEKVFFLL